MDLHYKISQWPSQDASDKDRRIAELTEHRDELLELADDACELMELSGMHNESGYRRLKEAIAKAEK